MKYYSTYFFFFLLMCFCFAILFSCLWLCLVIYCCGFFLQSCFHFVTVTGTAGFSGVYRDSEITLIQLLNDLENMRRELGKLKQTRVLGKKHVIIIHKKTVV